MIQAAHPAPGLTLNRLELRRGGRLMAAANTSP